MGVTFNKAEEQGRAKKCTLYGYGIECPVRKKERSWLTASTFSSREKGWGVNGVRKLLERQPPRIEIPHEGIGISLLPLTCPGLEKS